tara:strand:+ start:608 stop:736 length:129 start_codon:yes stop_codon:yes gene_type:complete
MKKQTKSKLKKISKQLVGASKMHAGQAKTIKRMTGNGKGKKK